VAILVGLFGLISVISGTSILFFEGPVRNVAGDYVPFVLWFNFLAGFAYMAGAVGLSLWRPWIKPLSIVIAGLTILVFCAFGISVVFGGAYEIRTFVAMAIRSLIWILIFIGVRKEF
ncbi:MAG: hypothetical protein ACR2O3_14345, partial [Rhizobiaceae bacterium]